MKKKYFWQRNKKIFKWLAIIVTIFLLLGLSVWGFYFYEKNFVNVSIEKILPSDANLVMRFTIDPNSEQFSFLEKNMEKFPGYSRLKKEMDDAGEGKTLSQIFQDKLKEKNLNFMEDIRPVIGENAYAIIPDAVNLRDNLKKEAILSQKKVKKYLASSVSNSQFLETGEEKKVMRESDFSISKNDPLQPSDFILASEIKDLKKAKEVLEKIKEDENYGITEKNFDGYKYYEVLLKKEGEKEEYLKLKKTYQTILGGNWIISSSEDYIKDSIERKKALEKIGALFEKNPPKSLLDDEQYQKTAKEIEANQKNKLAFFYVKMDSEKILRDSDCEKGSSCDPEKYLVFPKEIVFGILLSLSADGIETVFYGNKYDVGNFKNGSSEKSLASKAPLKENNKWLDLFFEYNNPKEAYYDFKNNGLTEEGRNAINSSFREFEEQSGFSVERDLVDLISGNVAWAGFFSSGESPDGVLILEVADSSKMFSSMEKIVETFKKIQMSLILMNSQYAAPENRQALQIEAEKNLKKIEETHIEKEIIPEGTLYKFRPYWEESLGANFSNWSLNFSLENNQLILGSSYEAVSAILKGMQRKESQTLANTESFKKASEKFYPERYSAFYLNTIGVWNGIQYYYNKFNENMALQQTKWCEENKKNFYENNIQAYDGMECGQSEEMIKKQNDKIFAIGALFRTIQFVSNSTFLGENFVKNSLFFSIKELPQEEKQRAEKIINEN